MPRRTTKQLVEELAISVGRGFQSVEEHVAATEKRMADRLDRIEFLVTGHEQRISVAEDRIRQLATRVGLTFN